MISKDILYNPLLLYSFVLVTFGQLILLSINEEWFFIGVLVVVCLLTSVFSKNLIVICVVGLCVLHVLQHQYKSSIEEGFGRKKRAKRRRRRIAKRRRKKWGGARRKLFGRTKQEKKRNKRKRRRNNFAAMLARMQQQKIEATLNNRINMAKRLPTQDTKIINATNPLKGYLSERYGQSVIDENRERIVEKLDKTKEHLNKFFSDFGTKTSIDIRNSSNLKGYKCKNNVDCSLYAETHARETIKEPLQELYRKILHGPQLYKPDDPGEIDYTSGNIVN